MAVTLQFFETWDELVLRLLATRTRTRDNTFHVLWHTLAANTQTTEKYRKIDLGDE